ncbi:MAG: Sulfotransferase domain protein [Betaproteobacteria bacterium ADurb.Bin341]|nr:MAG: Sulfotransferase domain protein [Betaproteobacteria bacterium ADurb.Bin341]
MRNANRVLLSKPWAVRQMDKFANQFGYSIARIESLEQDFEHCQKVSSETTGMDNCIQTVNQILVDEKVASEQDLASKIGNLVGLYQGYKQAYHAAAEELGVLRTTSAPVIRKDSASQIVKTSPDFLGRIGLWFDQTETKKVVERPSIFLVTLPKSGTIFISHSLRQTLGYDYTSTLVTPTFPKNIVWGSMLLDFTRGEMIAASHMQPDKTNLEILSRSGVSRIVLHIRDPRAVLLSWAYFVLLRLKKRGGVTPAPLISLDALDNLEYFVESSFPLFVAWIEGWVMALAEHPEINALVMTHDELSLSPDIYFQRIFDFYGLGSPELKLVSKGEGTHFRSGDNSEWRKVFPDHLIQKMNDQIPDRLWSKFGWVR